MSYETNLATDVAQAQKLFNLLMQIEQSPVSEETWDIVGALLASKGVFVDAHRQMAERTHHHFVVVEMGGGQFVAPAHTSGNGRWVCTLNPISLQADGTLVLSTCAKHMLEYRHCHSLQALTEAFNEQWANAAHCQAKIIHTFEV